MPRTPASACLSNTRGLFSIEARCGFEVANLVASASFFSILWCSESRRSVQTRLVKLTLLVEVFCSTVPTFISALFNYITGKSIAIYVGSTTLLHTNLEVCFCAFCYHWILHGRWHKAQQQQQTPAITHGVNASHSLPLHSGQANNS